MRRRHLLSLSGLVMVAPLLVGCGSDDVRPGPKPPAPSARFVTDELPTGITASLQEASVSEDTIVLDVVQQSAGAVYGIAFRLETDGEVLALGSLLPSNAFSGALTRAVEPEAGLMVGVVTKRGQDAGLDTSVIGSVTLNRKTAAGTRVTFVPERSRLFDEDARPIADVSFVGGELVVP